GACSRLIADRPVPLRHPSAGESVLMPTPVRCTIRPLSLRVRVPTDQPGVPEPRPPMAWAPSRDQALTFASTAGAGSGAPEETLLIAGISRSIRTTVTTIRDPRSVIRDRDTRR